jgi:hypothetical protein
MKKQKHTKHTLMVYFWKNNIPSVRFPDASWRNGCPGDNSSLFAVANEAFHYWMVEVETMICEVLICAKLMWVFGYVWVDKLKEYIKVNLLLKKKNVFIKLFHLVHSGLKAHCGYRDLLALRPFSLTVYQTYSSPGGSIHVKFLPCFPVDCPPGYTCWRHVLSVLVWIWDNFIRWSYKEFCLSWGLV